MRDRYFRGSLATLCYRGIFTYLAVFSNLVLFLCLNWVERIILSFLLWALGDWPFHTWGWLFPTCFGWSISMLNPWDLLVISSIWNLLSGLLWSSDIPICTLMRRIWSPTLPFVWSSKHCPGQWYPWDHLDITKNNFWPLSLQVQHS